MPAVVSVLFSGILRLVRSRYNSRTWELADRVNLQNAMSLFDFYRSAEVRAVTLICPGPTCQRREWDSRSRVPVSADNVRVSIPKAGRKDYMGHSWTDFVIQFTPITILSLVFGFTVRALAKEKGRNVALWTMLGFIPLINLFMIPYFVGAANLRLEGKLDAVLKALGQASISHATK